MDTYKLISIPNIGFGTYQLRNVDAYNMVLAAIKKGYRHIDTAKLYGNELDIGRAIKDSKINRGEIFVTTKVWITEIIGGPEKIIKSIKNSLIKLNLDYIDLVLLHAPIPDKLITSWQTMEDIYFGNIPLLKDKIRNIGVSNYNIQHLELILMRCHLLS